MVEVKPDQIFSLLESTDSEEVKETKYAIQETLSSTRESWLVAGLFEYYVKHGSLSCVDVLVVVREPHDKHLLDKINDAIKGNVLASRMAALTLLSYLIRRQPTWSYRIAKHSLLKDLIRLLKHDNDVPTVVCGVLLVVCLMPAIPAQISPHLSDIFSIFCRLSAWCFTKKDDLGETYYLQLQVALYSLFHRLYAIFPCNFLSYLRQHYSSLENHEVFRHILEPMLRLVRMHPSLVVASKDGETQSVRWKCMETHDIMAECSRVSLDPLEGTSEELLVKTSSSSHVCETSTESEEVAHGLLVNLAAECITLWSPSYSATTPVPSITERPRSEPAALPQVLDPVSVTNTPTPHDLDSPPEAAVEATPETTPYQTPIKDLTIGKASSQPFTSSFRKSISRAFGAKTTTGAKPTSIVPSESLPTSPSKVPGRRTSCPTVDKVSRLLMERHDISRPVAFGDTGSLTTDRDVHRPIPKPGGQLDMSKVLRGVTESSGEDKEVSEIVETIQKPRSATIVTVFDEEEEKQRCDSVITDIPSHTAISEVDSHSNYLALLHKVTRYRYHSFCTSSEHYATENGEDNDSDEDAGTAATSVRKRSISCPSSQHEKDTLRSTASPLKEVGDCCHGHSPDSENDGLAIERPKSVQSHGTQTDDELGGAQYLLHMAFPPPPPSKCSQCRKNSDSIGGFAGQSPYQIQEDHIANAVSLYKKKKPSGKEPFETGQLYALQMQLSYERHKREQHEERNRRLATKTRQGVVHYHNNLTLEKKVDEVKSKMKHSDNDSEKLKKDILKLREECENLRKQREMECGKLLRDNAKLQDENEKLKKHINKAEEEQKSYQTNLAKAEAIVHDSHNEVEKLLEKVSGKKELSQQLTRLRKQVLVLFDMNERYKNRLEELKGSSHHEEDMRLVRHSAAGQIKSLQNAVDSKTQMVDAQRQRLQDYEAMLNQKDEAMAKLKGSVHEAANAHAARLQALQQKYDALKAINRALEQNLLQMSLEGSPSKRPRGHSQPVDIPIPRAEPLGFQSLQDLVADAESKERFDDSLT